MDSLLQETDKVNFTADAMNKQTFKTKRCFLLILISTTIAELVTLVTVVGYWRVLRNDIMSPRQQQICLERHILFVADDEEEKEQCPSGFQKGLEKKKNSTICCGGLSDVLDKLSAKAVLEKYNSNANPETSKLNLTNYNCKADTQKQPKANLVDVAHDKNPVRVGVSSKLFWNTDEPSYANSGLMHLKDDGTIYVEKTGHYYVSSQLKTKIEITNDTEDAISDSTFRHYVYLISKGTGSVLLEHAKSQCEMTSNATESTSVIGSVFRLEHGDRLYVATSHPKHIVSDPQNNYFSIYRI